MQESRPFVDNDSDNLSNFWIQLVNKATSLYDSATSIVDDEFSLPVSQSQINKALQEFVTDKVNAILELRVELHDGWFRLYCTLEVAGIFAEVAGNFKLVHIQLDSNVQRFVFAQQTYTDVLKFRCESFIKRQGVKLFIWFYHRILKKDPLGFILSYINIARPKDNIIYLSIHRWLKKNKKIMSTLKKIQVNYGIVEKKQLVLKSNVNFRNILSSDRDEDIITPDDEPELMKGSIRPISDATDPSIEASNLEKI